MALKESKSLSIGQKMPSFNLNDPFETSYKLDSSIGKKGILIAFTCNHCPYAIAVWPRLIQVADYAKTQDITTVAINPNINPRYPSDSPENMKKFISDLTLKFPYLVDTTQSVAKAYNAQCTPDIYLLTHHKTLYYHGRIDDNWKEENNVTTYDLKNAILNLSLNQPAPEPQFPSMGCSIKWC